MLPPLLARARRPVTGTGLQAIVVVLITLALLGPAGCRKRISTNSIETIDAATVAQWLESRPERYLVVDARRAEAFQTAHIAGATRLDLPEVDERRPRREWQRYGAIIVYGENPGSIRAEAMTKRFLKIDPTQVYLLEGGFDRWIADGLPVVTAGDRESNPED